MQKIYELTQSQLLPFPRKEVFEFFKTPENLEKITPPWLHFVVTSPRPVNMCEGAEISYLVKPFGFPMKWTSLIEVYDPPYSFVDVQIKGPYRLWRHTHRFIDDGRFTRIEDHVQYSLPFGYLGRLAHYFKVRDQLNDIFRYRENAISKIFRLSESPSLNNN